MGYMRKINIVLEAPEKAQNIGAIIRNIYSFDAGTLFLPKDASLHKDIKSACGTGNKVHIQKVDNTIEFLQETQFRKIGFVVNQTKQYENAIPITEFNLKEKDKLFQNNDLLVFGAEGNGLSEEAIKLCDFLVTIPMLGHMACLNVATTTGIALYEVLRQKIERGCIILPKKPKVTKYDKIHKQFENMNIKEE